MRVLLDEEKKEEKLLKHGNLFVQMHNLLLVIGKRKTQCQRHSRLVVWYLRDTSFFSCTPRPRLFFGERKKVAW